MSMSEIYIDCEKHRQASQALKRLANDLGDSRASLSSAAGFVGDAWQGAAADAFLENNEWAAKDMGRLRLDLEELAADIDAAVTVFEEAERKLKGAD
jgi:WXG100 family type VII secretion target